MAAVDQLEIRAVRSSKSKIADEVIVVFPDLDIRDAVRSAAYNLAGASNAGIRLKIPESLRQSLRALESIAYMLKQKHPGLKRNVKFDDAAMNLVMDIKLDATWQWKKMRPDQALEASKGRAEPSREGLSLIHI